MLLHTVCAIRTQWHDSSLAKPPSRSRRLNQESTRNQLSQIITINPFHLGYFRFWAPCNWTARSGGYIWHSINALHIALSGLWMFPYLSNACVTRWSSFRSNVQFPQRTQLRSYTAFRQLMKASPRFLEPFYPTVKSRHNLQDATRVIQCTAAVPRQKRATERGVKSTLTLLHHPS